MDGPVLVRHDVNCQRPGSGHSDAAKRASDAYQLHKAALGYAALGRWLAIALADGSSDGVAYDCKGDAVRHQHHNELWYAYVCIGPGQFTVCEAEEYLATMRMLYDQNIRLTDPDHVAGGPDVIRRAAIEDDRSLMRSIALGGTTRPSNLIWPGRN